MTNNSKNTMSPSHNLGRSLSFNFSKTSSKNVKIEIGLNSINSLNELLAEYKADNIFIICDSVVAGLYLKKIQKKLEKAFSVKTIVHDAGEKNKNIKIVASILDEFFINGGTPKSIICSLGGGVTGNIAGFVASILFRGIKLVHIPTTLLSQLDSAPDVKQSVNTKFIKNSVGSYMAPNLVLIDPQFFRSLSEREIRSGYAEAIKHAFAQDLEFLNYIINLFKDDSYKNMKYLEEIIYKTINLKIKHWENTPTMWNDKLKTERLTHLGHTVGKILEMVDLDYLTHGEAIAHGMVIEFYISSKLGYLPRKKVEKAKIILDDIGLLYPLNEKYTLAKILQLLYRSEDEPLVALLKDFGNPVTVSMPLPKNITEEALDWYFGK